MEFRLVATTVLAAALFGCAQEGGDGPNADGVEDVSTVSAQAPVGEAIAAWSVQGATVLVEQQTGVAGVYSEPCVITQTSIAGISGPATLGDFVGAFPVGSTLAFEPLYMVDLGALCMIEGGAQKVCTYFLSYEVEEWDPAIEAEGLFTAHPDCRTAEGIGPGSPLADAVEVYGAPEFLFSYDNEGREYVSFADQHQFMGFRASSAVGQELQNAEGGNDVAWPNGEFGGDYRSSQTEFVTSTALPDAVVREIQIP